MFGKENYLLAHEKVLQFTLKTLVEASYALQELEPTVTKNVEEEIKKITIDAIVRSSAENLKRARASLDGKFNRLKLPIMGEIIYFLHWLGANQDQQLNETMHQYMELCFYIGSIRSYIAYGYEPPNIF